jgi:rod shape-determining protein MreD
MALLWIALLARDLLQVVFSGTALVPDLAVLALVWLSVFRCEEPEPIYFHVFWAGLLWDLRWTGVPGMTSASYILTAALTAWVWSSIPPGRRANPVLFFFWSTVSHVLTSVFPSVFTSKGLGFSPSLATQQGMAIACVLGLTALYIRYRRVHHE